MIIPAEMLTGGISAVLGAAIKIMAKRTEIQRMKEQNSLKKAAADLEAHNASVNRWKPAFARRFIAVFVTLYFFLAPALAAWKGIEVTFLYPEDGVSLLWGVFSSSENMEVVTLTGLSFMPVQRHVLVSIIGFFFGSECAK